MARACFVAPSLHAGRCAMAGDLTSKQMESMFAIQSYGDLAARYESSLKLFDM